MYKEISRRTDVFADDDKNDNNDQNYQEQRVEFDAYHASNDNADNYRDTRQGPFI